MKKIMIDWDDEVSKALAKARACYEREMQELQKLPTLVHNVICDALDECRLSYSAFYPPKLDEYFVYLSKIVELRNTEQTLAFACNHCHIHWLFNGVPSKYEYKVIVCPKCGGRTTTANVYHRHPADDYEEKWLESIPSLHSIFR